MVQSIDGNREDNKYMEDVSVVDGKEIMDSFRVVETTRNWNKLLGDCPKRGEQRKE